MVAGGFGTAANLGVLELESAFQHRDPVRRRQRTQRGDVVDLTAQDRRAEVRAHVEQEPQGHVAQAQQALDVAAEAVDLVLARVVVVVLVDVVEVHHHLQLVCADVAHQILDKVDEPVVVDSNLARQNLFAFGAALQRQAKLGLKRPEDLSAAGQARRSRPLLDIRLDQRPLSVVERGEVPDDARCLHEPVRHRRPGIAQALEFGGQAADELSKQISSISLTAAVDRHDECVAAVLCTDLTNHLAGEDALTGALVTQDCPSPTDHAVGDRQVVLHTGRECLSFGIPIDEVSKIKVLGIEVGEEARVHGRQSIRESTGRRVQVDAAARATGQVPVA